MKSITLIIGYICMTLGIIAIILGIVSLTWHNLLFGAGFVWLGVVHIKEVNNERRNSKITQ